MARGLAHIYKIFSMLCVRPFSPSCCIRLRSNNWKRRKVLKRHRFLSLSIAYQPIVNKYQEDTVKSSKVGISEMEFGSSDFARSLKPYLRTSQLREQMPSERSIALMMSSSLQCCFRPSSLSARLRSFAFKHEDLGVTCSTETRTELRLTERNAATDLRHGSRNT